MGVHHYLNIFTRSPRIAGVSPSFNSPLSLSLIRTSISAFVAPSFVRVIVFSSGTPMNFVRYSFIRFASFSAYWTGTVFLYFSIPIMNAHLFLSGLIFTFGPWEIYLKRLKPSCMLNSFVVRSLLSRYTFTFHFPVSYADSSLFIPILCQYVLELLSLPSSFIGYSSVMS